MEGMSRWPYTVIEPDSLICNICKELQPPLSRLQVHVRCHHPGPLDLTFHDGGSIHLVPAPEDGVDGAGGGAGRAAQAGRNGRGKGKGRQAQRQGESRGGWRRRLSSARRRWLIGRQRQQERQGHADDAPEGPAADDADPAAGHRERVGLPPGAGEGARGQGRARGRGRVRRALC